MTIHLLGAREGATFNRTFFQVTLKELIERHSRGSACRVRLFLVDGAVLNVCHINEIADAYVSVSTTSEEGECSESGHRPSGINLIPYGVVDRLEITAREDSSGKVGFHWPGARNPAAH